MSKASKKSTKPKESVKKITAPKPEQSKNIKNEAKLTVKDTREIAELARLALTPEEEAKFTSQLNNILGYFNKLSELNTDNVEPKTHPTDMVNSFREDVVKESLKVDEALQNAPHKEKNYFKAPRIL